MKKIRCIFLLCVCYSTTQAQFAFQVGGTITDTVGVALSRATVKFISGQDTLSTITGDNGAFYINNFPKNKFILQVTMKGYVSYSHSFIIPGEKRLFRLQPIALKIDYSELDPVVVTRVRPITIGVDTISYNVAAFLVPDGSEVEDILKKLPGVQVDFNGNVTVGGKIIGKVLVNGKEFFGGDVLLAIRNLPADVVAKLQIIDDYGDKARLTGVKTGDAAKVLNIVLKADKRNGEFGRGQATIGNQSKYAVDAFGNAFKGERQISLHGDYSNNSPTGSDPVHNAGINYADDWGQLWSGSINIAAGSQSPNISSMSTTDNFYSGEKLNQSQSIQSVSHRYFTNLENTINYKPSKYETMRFTLSGGTNHSSNQTSGSFTSLQQDSNFNKSTIGTSLTENHAQNNGLNSNIYFEKLYTQSKRRFNAQLGFTYASTQQITNNQSTAAIIANDTSSNSLLHYLVTNNSSSKSINAAITYFTPLSHFSFFEIGYRGQFSLSHANIQTQNLGLFNSPPIIIDSLSQIQSSQTHTQTLHLGYIANLNHLAISTGIDCQYGSLLGSTDTKGNVTSYTYLILLPSVQGSWTLSKSTKFSIDYSIQPNLPSLQQLAPYTNITNPQYPIVGNPALKPSYTHTASLQYEQSNYRATKFSGFGLGLSYSITENTITSVVTHPKDTSQVVQYTTFLNTGPTNTISSNYHLTLPAFLNNWIRVSANGNLSCIENTEITDNLRYTNATTTWAQALQIQMLIPNLVETNFEGNYSISRSVYPRSVALPNISKQAQLSLTNEFYLSHNWTFNFHLSKVYTSVGGNLQPTPGILNASLQRSLLAHKKAALSISAYNILNSTGGIGQSALPTSITKTTTQLTGRYFLLSFLLKLNRF